MENIDRISFFNHGKFVRDSDDYFDALETGVVILFGEENNYIGYYKLNSDTPEIEKIEKIDAFDDWIKPVSKFLKKSFKINDELLLESLFKSADEEDEDGFYHYIEENGGEVVFENPNSEIDENANIYMVKQMTEGEYSTDGKKINIGSDIIDLKNLSSGHFDDNSEIVVYWHK